MLISLCMLLLCLVLSCTSNEYRESAEYHKQTEETEQAESMETEIETEMEAEVIYKKISGVQARQMMEELTAAGEDFILLDVRTDEEFIEQRIEGAILIPDYEIEWRSALDLPDTDMVILIYCRTGRRSADVARLLIAMGYTRVYDFGGIQTDWDYDTVSG